MAWVLSLEAKETSLVNENALKEFVTGLRAEYEPIYAKKSNPPPPSTKPLSPNFSIAYSEITRVTPRFPSPSHLENKELVHRGLKEISPSAAKTKSELINEIVEELV